MSVLAKRFCALCFASGQVEVREIAKGMGLPHGMLPIAWSDDRERLEQAVFTLCRSSQSQPKTYWVPGLPELTDDGTLAGAERRVDVLHEFSEKVKRALNRFHGMTNVQFVTHLMEYSNYGALAQLFIIDALDEWSKKIAATPIEEVRRQSRVTTSTRHAVACEIQAKLREREE